MQRKKVKLKTQDQAGCLHESNNTLENCIEVWLRQYRSSCPCPFRISCSAAPTIDLGTELSIPALSSGFSNPGQAAPATASTSQAAADTAAQPSPGAPSTSHHAADLLASRLAPPAAQGGSPAPQLPVPLKKKQYKAEPAPSVPSPAGAVMDAADNAAVGGYPSSVAEKQVGLRGLPECKPLLANMMGAC